MRALRVDKMTYAALEATLSEYVAGRATGTVPVQTMLTLPLDEIRSRAETLTMSLRQMNGWRAEALEGTSAVGGGSAPGIALPTWLIAIEKEGMTPDALEARLRQATPPVIARIEQDRVRLDLRTVLPFQDSELLKVLQHL
jgi:L-seryl-tRNA(Ser) seleniumtransferase